MMRVLVCGGRNYDDLGSVWGQLDACHALEGPIACIIQGGAAGADLLAAKWAAYNDVRCVTYSPDLMLSEGKPDLVIAFPGGTADMIRQAKEAGVPVRQP
jgi:hypothetical protein